jgi:cell envelope opacity-associated protein A
LTASAQTTSPNLVPLPNHWTTNGQSVVQSYAINQALALSGSDVRINGFDYGYQYNLGNSWSQCTAHNQDGSCSWTMTFNPRVDVNVSIRDNNNAQIYGTTHTEIGANTGNRSRDFQYRFNDPRDILTLGNFNYTASTSPNATVFGMYSRANYSVVTTTRPTFSDDSYVHVPLQFGFPFYGRTFTNSWMHSNGVISFLDPSVPIEGAGWNPGAGAYCCSGERPTVNTPQFSYMIAPLWTDLYPVAQSTFRTEGNGQYQRYYWENIAEISNMNNLSTFGVEIRPSGFIGTQYSNVNIQNQNTWIGTIGNPRLGEWNEIQYGSVINSANRSNWSLPETQAADCSNPLSNPACPGYAQAYFTQQCSINPLYNSQCPNYATAYFNQQCTINTLYNTQCPGYATAYYDYQCSANALYHTGCPNYATAYFNQQCSLDPLYNDQCPGYSTAYFNQQCSINPLYDTGCTGYADAYYVQQCTADPLYDSGCTGYETAYFNQQCSINPLYNNQCPGYATAYFDQQCSLNPLYNTQCPGYATAYFNQQCSIDALYNNQCPGYGEAYAKKNILNIGNTVTTPTTETAVVVVAEEVKTESTTATPSETKVVADPVVNNVVTATSTSTNAAANPAAAVQLTAPAPAPAATTAVAAKTEEKKEEKKTETTASASSTSAPAASSSNSSGGQKTTRQALAERRLEAARAAAVERGKNLGSEVAGATSMEKQVELQNVVVAAMGFTPGFDAYGRVNLQDAIGYKPFAIYPGQRNIDTPAGRRLLSGSDRLHQEMVDAQYR